MLWGLVMWWFSTGTSVWRPIYELRIYVCLVLVDEVHVGTAIRPQTAELSGTPEKSLASSTPILRLRATPHFSVHQTSWSSG